MPEGKIVPLCTGCDEARHPLRPYLVADADGYKATAHYCVMCADIATTDPKLCAVALVDIQRIGAV